MLNIHFRGGAEYFSSILVSAPSAPDTAGIARYRAGFPAALTANVMNVGVIVCFVPLDR